jgi:2'-5' RNA ligase
MPDSPDPTWRCFVAVPASTALRRTLETTIAEWRAESTVPDLRWTDPEGWHVTLAFLGATDPASVPGLDDRIGEAVVDFAPLVVSTGEPGAFPRPGAAQSVWLGLDDPDGTLGDLAAAVQEAVLPPDRRRPLRAHLTLGRSRVRRGEPLGPWLATRAVPVTRLHVEDVVLYRSHLGPGPARYEELARLPLGGAGSTRG